MLPKGSAIVSEPVSVVGRGCELFDMMVAHDLVGIVGKREPTRYARIAWDGAKIEALFVDLFLEAHQQPPQQIILDLDATDDPLHGHQEGRFFHGYYDCYCYLPLYIFCGSHLLAVKQRCANIDASAGAVEETARIVAQIRARRPEVRIVLRADSGFARDGLMSWCEANGEVERRQPVQYADLGRDTRQRERDAPLTDPNQR